MELCNVPETDFVTVVTVGVGDEKNTEEQNEVEEASTFVTVLTIGDGSRKEEEICEEVLVYRLPGERLGFGLKFEGGTKTSECVRRLFIQSCAPDSPASRVQSTWGSLVEGDEVLQIDAQPVKTMTRIDCVRCLKDSNVVIKLLVKHNAQPVTDLDETDRAENLPLVVKAEKKRIPPPPPVPPRKVSRKKEGTIVPPRGFADEEAENNSAEKTEKPERIPSSPRNMSRTRPEQPPPRIRDRRSSDGSSGPPDAEVYLDLLSHELEYGLRAESESDDTGSTISTVMDKQFSCFSERCSIASDSIPSTPTAIQKQMDLTKVLNPFEILEMEFESNNNDYLLNKLASTQDIFAEIAKTKSKNIEPKEITPVQPENFLDAHLSYGNEEVRTILREEHAIWEDDKIKEMNKINKQEVPKPTPRKCYAKRGLPPSPPQREDLEKPILPRLVNLIPKTPTKDTDEPKFDSRLIKSLDDDSEPPSLDKFENFPPSSFEENSYLSLDIVSLEKISDFRPSIEGCGTDDCEQMCGDSIDDEKYFIFKWSSSGQLATIGEDEEFESSDINSR